MKELTIYTDGASRGNPGPASYGFSITDNSGKVLYEEGKTLGITTNNVAEYTAVLEALEYVKDNFSVKPLVINFFMDSKLVAEQLSGNYKIKSPHLRVLIDKINILKMEVGNATFVHVPRAQNKRADYLANLALDSR